MEDIEVVIKIPDVLYELCKRMYDTEGFEPLMIAVKHGTPLPKGHGRLIDADDIALIDEQFYVPSDYYVAESAINDAPTIIEANTESEEV